MTEQELIKMLLEARAGGGRPYPAAAAVVKELKAKGVLNLDPEPAPKTPGQMIAEEIVSPMSAYLVFGRLSGQPKGQVYAPKLTDVDIENVRREVATAIDAAIASDRQSRGPSQSAHEMAYAIICGHANTLTFGDGPHRIVKWFSQESDAIDAEKSLHGQLSALLQRAMDSGTDWRREKEKLIRAFENAGPSYHWLDIINEYFAAK